jgi:hypothetical protein
MSSSANVQSTEAIELIRAALQIFSERASDAIVTLELEMRHVLEWVEHDRPRHWKIQNRLAVDQLNEAQAALHRCIMFPKTVNERPSCHEERQAVKVAQARLDYCQRKAERVRHWKRILPHEISEYKGRISRLKRLVEYEVPEAIGVLEKILLRLDEYRALRVSPAEIAYNQLAFVQEIWPEKPNSALEPSAAPAPFGEAASAAGEPATNPNEA